MAVFTIPKPESVDVPSSNRVLNIPKTTSFSPGTLVPILCKDILPGDNVRVNLDSLIESLPMIAPNLNGYKASFDFYFCPWSNYYGWMDNNNRMSTEELVALDRWWYTFKAPLQSADGPTLKELYASSVKPGSLLDYLGLPPGYCGKIGENGKFVSTIHPAEKLLSVLDIYRNFYVNQQERYCYFIVPEQENTVSENGYFKVLIRDLDEIIKNIRNIDYADDILSVLDGESEGTYNPYDGSLMGYTQILSMILGASSWTSLGGLPLRTYRMDLNRGLLSDEVGNVKSRVTITDNGFDIDTLRFANKMQTFIDRIDISGGKFSDMMRARWGVKPRGTMNVPDYLGSVSSFFGITDVLATASGMNSSAGLGDRGNSVLGQQAGFAVNKLRRENNPISFRADQYGTLVCMFSLVPLVTYSQGIEREDLKTSFADIYDPAFAQLGYQDVSPLELSVFPEISQDIAEGAVRDDIPLVFESGAIADGLSVGKRVAWAEYMSALPRAHGLFAYGESLDYWANNRLYTDYLDYYRYEGETPLNFFEKFGRTDYSTYIKPSLQNNLFADVSFDAQNFRLRVNFDLFMRREIGSRVMPHL